MPARLFDFRALGSVQVAPLAAYLHVGLVHVPAASDGPSTSVPERIADHRCEPLFPGTDRLMSELKAAFQEHLGQVSKAELVAEPPPHHREDHVGGKPKEVEGRAGPLVELALAGSTPEAAVAEDGLLLELSGRPR